MEKSTLKNLGLRIELRPALPNSLHPGWPHGPDVSGVSPPHTSAFSFVPPVPWNQYPAALGSPARLPSWTLPARSAMQGPASISGEQLLRFGVNGNPLEKFVELLMDQPPMIRSAALPTPDAHFLPCPKGKSQTCVKMNTWLR